MLLKRQCLAGVVAVVTSSTFSSGHALADDLISAASENHLWFVMPASQTRRDFVLAHHARDMEGPFFGIQASLTDSPTKIAAWQSHVWMVINSPASGAKAKPEVFSLEVSRSAALGGYVSIPSDRLEITPPLPASGTVVAFTATEDGPAVLLVPPQSKPGVLTARPPTPTIDEVNEPQLYWLKRGKWDQIKLPPEVAAGSQYFMVGTHVDNGLCIFTNAKSDPEQALRFDWMGNEWASSRVALNLKSVRSITSVAGQIAAVIEKPGGPIEVVCIRALGLLHLAEFPQPTGQWSCMGMGDQLILLERGESGKMLLQKIDVVSGLASSSQVMTVEPVSAAKLWQMAMFGALVISGLLLAFLVRPSGASGAVVIPDGFEPLSLGLRTVAIFIDLFPAGVIASLIWRSSIGEMLTMPLFTINFEQSVPYLTMIGLGLLHTTIGEAITGKSLGKAIIGAKISRLDGSAPTPAQALLRNAIKFLELLVPPLAAVVLFNHYRQGVHDLASGTIVVGHIEKPSEDRMSGT